MERLGGCTLRQVLRCSYPQQQGDLHVNGVWDAVRVDLRPALLQLLGILCGCPHFEHGDIKPENIMVMVDEHSVVSLRLIDVAPRGRDLVIG